MEPNKTSLALHSMQFFDPDNLKNPFDINLKAVLEYAKRMEEELERLAESNIEDEMDATTEERRFMYAGQILGMKVAARVALSFDPLSK